MVTVRSMFGLVKDHGELADSPGRFAAFAPVVTGSACQDRLRSTPLSTEFVDRLCVRALASGLSRVFLVGQDSTFSDQVENWSCKPAKTCVTHG